jgi:2-C-methyl-D-erythritol 2,4-cyclodiphosphate synthase
MTHDGCFVLRTCPCVGFRDNLCDLLETHKDCVNIKAKTHEEVDSIGEERSIACHTVVMLVQNSQA